MREVKNKETGEVRLKGNVGLTAGVFDLLHPGHLLMLEYCKKHCGYLVVALQTDPSKYRKDKRKPVETMYERYIRLMHCKYVDEVIPYDSEDDLRLLLTNEEYDVRFIGEDHKGHEFTGHDIRKETFHFNPRSHTLSSSSLRDRILGEANKEIQNSPPLLEDFLPEKKMKIVHPMHLPSDYILDN